MAVIHLLTTSCSVPLCKYTSVCIHSIVDGHLGCVQFGGHLILLYIYIILKLYLNRVFSFKLILTWDWYTHKTKLIIPPSENEISMCNPPNPTPALQIPSLRIKPQFLRTSFKASPPVSQTQSWASPHHQASATHFSLFPRHPRPLLIPGLLFFLACGCFLLYLETLDCSFKILLQLIGRKILLQLIGRIECHLSLGSPLQINPRIDFVLI